MPKIRWEDLSDIRHNILSALQKTSIIERKSSELNAASKALRQEIVSEVSKYDAIINRLSEDDRNGIPVEKERRK